MNYVSSIQMIRPSTKVFLTDHKHKLDIFNRFNFLRVANPKNIFSCININYIRHKFESLKVMTGETKIYKTSLTTQFKMPGFYTPYRLGVSSTKGGLFLTVKNHLPLRQLINYAMPKDIQVISFKVNLKKKRLFVAIDKLPLQNKQCFFQKISALINFHSNIYDHLNILSDFKMKPELASFMESYILINLIKSETYFKNCKSCLKNTSTFETGFGDHHHLIYSIFKTTFRNEELENIFYRDYSQINPANFKLDLEDSGLKTKTSETKNPRNIFDYKGSKA